MTHIPSSLTIRVDERRLIGEIGLLFGSIGDALAEVVQNAYRARATRLDVLVSGKTLVLADDGPGLADPEFLFTIARSGWDDGVATDPAGMGAFALFALAEHVEVESVPEVGAAWIASFGSEVFTGGTITVRALPEPSRARGLAIRVRLKPEVRLPDLQHGGWRHRFPLEVTLSLEGAEAVVIPPVEAWPDAVVVATPVGSVAVVASRLAQKRSRALWEHRMVSFPDDPVRRLERHLPDTAAGAVVRAQLQGKVIEWRIDPSSTGARPKLPDRTHLIDDAALDHALREIAAFLVDQVEAEEVLRLAGKAVADRDILVDDELRSVQAGAAAGALGTTFPLSAVMPFLGYGKAWRATRPETWRVNLAIHGDDYQDEWTPLVDRMWVRPRFRVESDAVEMLALAEGVPAVLPTASFPEAVDLPLAHLDAATLHAATSIGQLFATDLHLVSSGVRLAPVTHVFTREMTGDGADDALPPKWSAAVKGLPTGPDGFQPPYPFSYWLGLHPLPEGVRAIDYVLRSRAFRRQALRESAADEWPVAFWDYAEAHNDHVDTKRLVRDLADLFARELGPATAAEVLRESRAVELGERFAEMLGKVGRTLARGFEDEIALGLHAESLTEIHETAARLRDLLAAATPERLLGRPAARP